jgi:pimeloyl-ACP methyl ester carboxylesterase
MTTLDQSTPILVPTALGRLNVRMVGSGPPAVLWHSMFADSTSWQRIEPQLAQHRRLILVDAPSSGGSDPLRRAVDIGACAEAAGEVIDQLRPTIGAAPLDWVGSAWGGHVGLHLAATRPELLRSLVAISAPTQPISAELRRKIAVLVPLYRLIGPRGPVLSAILDTLLTEQTRAVDPDGVQLLTGPLRRAGRRGMALAIRTAILNRTDLAWAATTIHRPVLFVTTDDRGEWTPEAARVMAAQMPDASEVTVPRSRVLPSIEQPELLVEAITRFWRERVA